MFSAQAYNCLQLKFKSFHLWSSLAGGHRVHHDIPFPQKGLGNQQNPKQGKWKHCSQAAPAGKLSWSHCTPSPYSNVEMSSHITKSVLFSWATHLPVSAAPITQTMFCGFLLIIFHCSCRHRKHNSFHWLQINALSQVCCAECVNLRNCAQKQVTLPNPSTDQYHREQRHQWFILLWINRKLLGWKENNRKIEWFLSETET